IKRYAPAILVAGLVLCVLLAISGWLELPIAKCSLGACRWFSLGPFGSIQPAELLKFGILVFSAAFLGSRASKGLINDVQKTLIPYCAIVGVAAMIIVVVQNDLGTGLSLASIAGTMLLIAGLNIRNGALLIAIGLALVAVFILIAP